MNEKNCGSCIHWRKLQVSRKGFKNGRCGLGYHNADETPSCRVYNEGNYKEASEEKRMTEEELASFTGTQKGRFTTDVWSQWRKK